MIGPSPTDAKSATTRSSAFAVVLPPATSRKGKRHGRHGRGRHRANEPDESPPAGQCAAFAAAAATVDAATDAAAIAAADNSTARELPPDALRTMQRAASVAWDCKTVILLFGTSDFMDLAFNWAQVCPPAARLRSSRTLAASITSPPTPHPRTRFFTFPTSRGSLCPSAGVHPHWGPQFRAGRDG